MRRKRTARNHAVTSTLLAFVAAILVASMLSGCSLFGAPPLSNDPKNLFAQAEPATVLIFMNVSAHVSVPDWQVDWDTLNAQVRADVKAGNVQDTEAATQEHAAALVTANPLTYLISDPALRERQVDIELRWSGSGFIADPSGYVVTNAHVAAPTDDDLKQMFATSDDLRKIRASDERYLADKVANFAYGTPLSAWYARRMKLDNVDKEVNVIVGSTAGGTDVTVKPILANVVAAGEPYPGKDVAVLKFDGKNLPTIPIADDKTLVVGDKLFVVGFPAAAGQVTDYTKNLTNPSFTAGVVSGRKQMPDGFEVIQTDAAISGGNSGGPVLDDRGRVVGLATFTAVDQGSGGRVAGVNFLMPTTVLSEIIGRSGARPGEGTFNTLYKQGLAQEAAGQRKAALDTFRQINEISPGHPYVQRHISDNQSAIAAGKDRSLPMAGVLAVGCCGFAVLVLIVAVAVLLLRRRGKKAAGGASQVSSAGASEVTAAGASEVSAPMPAAAIAEAGAAISGEEATVGVHVKSPSGERDVALTLPAVVGSSPDCTLTIEDSGISPMHLALSMVGGVLIATDMRSSSGTLVNGTRTGSAEVKAGDVIGIGASEITVGS